ncbi:MAG: tRNA dihydrouridine(20/20a) synthase DusA [Alphaproteobacteria bacterium]
MTETAPNPVDRRLSVAPMMDWTDRHCRSLLRLIAPRTLLYTEMVTTGAVLHGDRDRLLGFDAAEHPVACQLGGSNPDDLAKAARIVEQWGYCEVNLNVGCPSDRVQSGLFGACLMADPPLVADCISAMREAVSIPVTIKHRIGIDDRDSYDHLAQFVEIVAATGCTGFAVHARKAILSGLNPKENREIPPLHYETVYRLKADFPDLEIVINGGIQTSADVAAHLEKVDGVMIGRAAYATPFVLAAMEKIVFGDGNPDSGHGVVRKFLPYIDAHLARGGSLNHITRHMVNLFAGKPGARAWRRYLSENAYRPGADRTIVEQALALVPEDTEAAQAG